MDIVKICVVCGGFGKFLDKPCPRCKGKGGKFNRPDLELISQIDEIEHNLSEEEQTVLGLYKEGHSQKEISQQLDLSLNRVMLILRHINQVYLKLQAAKNESEQKLF